MGSRSQTTGFSRPLQHVHHGSVPSACHHTPLPHGTPAAAGAGSQAAQQANSGEMLATKVPEGRHTGAAVAVRLSRWLCTASCMLNGGQAGRWQTML